LRLVGCSAFASSVAFRQNRQGALDGPLFARTYPQNRAILVNPVRPPFADENDQENAMKYRKLGSSDLNVSEISLGSWLTFGVGVERDRAEQCVDRAFDLGINFIDTANVYGRGAAESFLGEVLARRPRDSYILATKVFFPMSDTDHGLSQAQIRKQIDASLKRLRVDHIDLYQCHRYDSETPLEETMEALSEVVRQGKARYIGFSEWSPDQIRAAFAIAGVERFVSSQPQYSLLWRRPEKEVIPLCKEKAVSQIVWSPLGQGVLTGKYRPDTPPPTDSRASSDTMGHFIQRLTQPDILKAVQGLKPIADQAGCSLAQFALAWVLREPNVASAIVGASRPEQVDENAAASGLSIDPRLFAQAEKIVDAATS
jgi:aryl-alcohol dehydrogenase-like predicted oxidoreductase